MAVSTNFYPWSTFDSCTHTWQVKKNKKEKMNGLPLLFGRGIPKNTKIGGSVFSPVGLVFSKSNLVFFRQFGIFPSILVFFKFIWY